MYCSIRVVVSDFGQPSKGLTPYTGPSKGLTPYTGPAETLPRVFHTGKTAESGVQELRKQTFW
jgi:hypothetical protein